LDEDGGETVGGDAGERDVPVDHLARALAHDFEPGSYLPSCTTGTTSNDARSTGPLSC
jgi:hypothetical protein